MAPPPTAPRRLGRRQPAADPVDLYLAQLAPGSRRVMRASLELIADCLSGGRHSSQTFPWHRATYAQAARLRAEISVATGVKPPKPGLSTPFS